MTHVAADEIDDASRQPLLAEYLTIQRYVMSVVYWAGRGLTKLPGLGDADGYPAENILFVGREPMLRDLWDDENYYSAYHCAEVRYFSLRDLWTCNNWIIGLAYMVGCTEALLDAGAAVPFRDLFIWADGGWVAGPKTSARVAAEFAEWDERAKKVAYEDFYAIYVRMREMFEWCALDGAVCCRSVG
ncbi:hypothetical protein PPMP20_17060 [Paraburkholderia phymatum]|uniref:Uncharacterized protein n=1 Tax=Paraburkholderia phymatum (strain DSM 17167 / CIP 108236 / LMG 21445 / STM815) TaxID=391038 RepID=B2JT75_PARP8|nr:hypothetical protein [Paraburkholderia phymatum]ACC75778.1 conserved hypothetical protein [Paraburkholderia phymatum STM815]